MDKSKIKKIVSKLTSFGRDCMKANCMKYFLERKNPNYFRIPKNHECDILVRFLNHTEYYWQVQWIYDELTRN